MNEFEPSKHFVANVMDQIRVLEQAKKKETRHKRIFFSPGMVRFVCSTGAALLGVLNLIRLYFSVFSPIVCR